MFCDIASTETYFVKLETEKPTNPLNFTDGCDETFTVGKVWTCSMWYGNRLLIILTYLNKLVSDDGVYFAVIPVTSFFSPFSFLLFLHTVMNVQYV